MTDALSIGSVSLPLDAVTRTFAILGQRGTGKTTGAVVLVEEMAAAGGHVAILDPVGAWWGIMHAGERPGLEGIVIGGEHGDVPLEETGGQLVAELVTSRYYPVIVIDMKLLRKGAQLRFMADYCEALFHLSRCVTSKGGIHCLLELSGQMKPGIPRQAAIAFLRGARIVMR
jgi:hypothetical protein